MANDVNIKTAIANLKFNCCDKLCNVTVVCINCGSSYHAAHINKDDNIEIVKGSLVKCCESSDTKITSKEQVSQEIENLWQENTKLKSRNKVIEEKLKKDEKYFNDYIMY